MNLLERSSRFPPKKEERKIVRNAEILARYLIGETKSMVMGLIRFESSAIIYELVFDPTRYKALEWKDRFGLKRFKSAHVSHLFSHSPLNKPEKYIVVMIMAR